MASYSGSVSLNAVEEIFRQHEWKYQIADGHLLTIFEDVPMVFGVEPERELLMLQVPLVQGQATMGRVRTLTSAERDVCVYIATANYQLVLGAFTRDHRDGEIRYECTIPLIGSSLTSEQVELMILVAGVAVTFHAPAIVGILTGRIALQQALSALDRMNNPQQQAV